MNRLGSNSIATRWIRAAALLHYLFLATGMPLPVRAEKDTSVPFPCMSRGCSCRDAEQCARTCCCFPKAQQLVWYRERRLSPPVSLLAEGREVEPPRSRSPKRSCCCSHDPMAPATACVEPSVTLTNVECNLSISDEAACRGFAKGAAFSFVALVPPMAELPDSPDCYEELLSGRFLRPTYVPAPAPPPPRRA